MTAHQQPLATFAENAYREYAMYVILDRALPHIGDGLKPVQRRIVYAMSELGLSASAKHKKSARTVGDVLGKFHPHGDSACYEAMVNMAQPFGYRYPLIDGQGNWGSIDDPKAFAAMRYTESRLTAYANTLLQEIKNGAITWQPNFDGTLKEPTLLPAQLPNILLNGATGIAVGMSTDIPSHRLSEVIAATIYLIDHPKATIAQLMEHLPGPDFASGGCLLNTPEEIGAIYEKGQGSLKARAGVHTEGQDIIIDSLPPQVSSSRLLEQIAKQMQLKKLPQVDDLRDESDEAHPVRIIITLKRRQTPESVIAHLLATTELEKSIKVNLNVIGLDGKPAVKNLKTLLAEWLEFRQETMRRGYQHRLDAIHERRHILAGLLTIFLDIEKVIHIVRFEEEPKTALMDAFTLSEIQAQAILDTRLKQLSRLEAEGLQKEDDSLRAEESELRTLLTDQRALQKALKSQLRTLAKQYQDERKTQFLTQAISAKAHEPTPDNEPITLILSKQGWIRQAKGHDIELNSLIFRTGDSLLAAARTHSQHHLLVFDDTGRVYALNSGALPSARGQGEPLTAHIQSPSGATFVGLLGIPQQSHVVFCNHLGQAFVAKADAIATRQKNGKQVVNLPQNTQLLSPISLEENDQWLAVITSLNRFAFLKIADIPHRDKGQGKKLLRLKKNESISTYFALNASDKLAFSKNASLDPTRDKNYLIAVGQAPLALPKNHKTPAKISGQSHE